MLSRDQIGRSSIKSQYFIASILVSLSATACATKPQMSTAMPYGAASAPPRGLVKFCDSFSAACQPKAPRIVAAEVEAPVALPLDSLIANSFRYASGEASVVLAKAATQDFRGLSETSKASDPSGLQLRGLLSTEPKLVAEVQSISAQQPDSFVEFKAAAPSVIPLLKRLEQSEAQSISLVQSTEDLETGLPELKDKVQLASLDFAADDITGAIKITSASASDAKSWSWQDTVRQIRPVLSVKKAATPAKTPSRKINLDDETFKQIERVNRTINARIVPKTDREIYAESERWAMPITYGTTRYGDCEDYALEKRAALIAAGFPEEALYLAIGYSRETGRHAVLMIETHQGDYALDNMTSKIKPWYETPYKWISRQKGGNLLEWARHQEQPVKRRDAKTAEPGVVASAVGEALKLMGDQSGPARKLRG
tara:strand:- start:6108 stop:7388 length:1281 start_codon:yes stop_codon:yes gene_type:complete